MNPCHLHEVAPSKHSSAPCRRRRSAGRGKHGGEVTAGRRGVRQRRQHVTGRGEAGNCSRSQGQQCTLMSSPHEGPDPAGATEGARWVPRCRTAPNLQEPRVVSGVPRRGAACPARVCCRGGGAGPRPWGSWWGGRRVCKGNPKLLRGQAPPRRWPPWPRHLK